MSAYHVKLSLLFLLFVSCQSLRNIDFCNIGPRDIASCADNDSQYELQYPEGMFGWRCFSEEDMITLGGLIQKCESEDHLPPSDSTFEHLTIYVCPDDRIKEGYICTDEKGFNKIKAKIDWCRRT